MKIVAVESIGIDAVKLKQISKTFLDLGHEFVFYSDRQEDENTLVDRMKDADIVIVSNIKLSENVLSKCPKLKMLSIAFTGVDHIDLEYCKKANIVVCNASGYATDAVSELTVGLIIDLYRNITFLDNKTRQGGSRNNFLGRQLRDKVVGIVGTGAIGSRTALLLQQFGCKVLAWSRTEKTELKEKGIQYVSLEELLSQSDIISLHVPLTEETQNLINKKRLAMCKSSAVLINTARGKVVDIDALAEALEKKHLAGTAIDVFEAEPPLMRNHPLLSAPNCLVVPHIGFATIESFEKRIDIVINNILAYLQGKVINKIL